MSDGIPGAEAGFCHSSHGGECGAIELVKDAIGSSKERPSQATGYGTGSAGTSKLASLTGAVHDGPTMPTRAAFLKGNQAWGLMLENRESTETREQNGETRANDAEIRAKTVHSCKPCSQAVLTAEGVIQPP